MKSKAKPVRKKGAAVRVQRVVSCCVRLTEAEIGFLMNVARFHDTGYWHERTDEWVYRRQVMEKLDRAHRKAANK